MKTEKEFENKVKRFLRSVGIYSFGTTEDEMKVEICGYYEKRFANRNTKSGMPDLHIVIKGVSLEVELKKLEGKPSALQLFNINLIRKSGALGIILYPEQFEEFKILINNLIHNSSVVNLNDLIVFDERYLNNNGNNY